jgi:TPR repeat protein
MALERVCNDAREMTVARCELSDEGCPHAAELLSTMAAVGLGVSRTQRDAVDKRAFDVVRRACDRGDAPACLAVADAHERGVGAKRDDNAAKRARRDACRLDAATCR